MLNLLTSLLAKIGIIRIGQPKSIDLFPAGLIFEFLASFDDHEMGYLCCVLRDGDGKIWLMRVGQDCFQAPPLPKKKMVVVVKLDKILPKRLEPYLW